MIAALVDHLEERFWRSAVWLGVGSAAAPTVVFAGAAMGLRHVIRWAREDANLRYALRIILWGGVALSGLLMFVAYQFIAFHSPLAFIAAQASCAPDVLGRLWRLIDVGWYIMPLRIFVWHVETAIHSVSTGFAVKGIVQIEKGIQYAINFIVFFISVIGLLVASINSRVRETAVIWVGWAVFLGYEWFLFSTNEGMGSTARLLAPGIAFFLGLGLLVSRSHAWLRYSLLFGLGTITFCEVAFVAAGYWVV